ncbi:glycerol-3-phosphate dehydrogenase (FAD-dependent) [Trypanosoma rangeli]|uniref:Glycerol-3-phosphate dehydrogenase (FAD-dependent) n=1 Tax=Trypanosoma rangeli TaxID=5698 RepID=A0A3R7LTT0_TRYRA|nr:glycerol-3-phosphate dehydrogenase (FAD-dependent) [Trypanosoma rangeli]RNF03180.1 glycerol-3-phosphate dehydrogenase (FAD-dependent) [Trypanosoma rangeli]|eukprot:RNF03180.1 glycerol-3-phosphate dehydrogenase (FAD-dependent) [Trypanosoma rangeli]
MSLSLAAARQGCTLLWMLPSVACASHWWMLMTLAPAALERCPHLSPVPFRTFSERCDNVIYYWLRRGVEVWRALTVWSNVALGLVQSGVSTLIPSSHSLELMELTTAAVIAMLFSPFLGVWKPFHFVRGDALRTEGHETENEVQGGVLLQDTLLDGNAASVALARTVEALGAVVLNYASVMSIAEVEATPRVKGHANFAVVVNDVSAPKGVGASTSRGLTVYTRNIVNCAGSWVDEVKQLMPTHTTDAVPSVVARHQVKSYFVLPHSAVHPMKTKNMHSRCDADAMFALTDLLQLRLSDAAAVV